MNTLTPQRAIADVLLHHDDLTVSEVIARAAIAMTRPQATQILLDAVRRKHVTRYLREGHDENVYVYSLSMVGRNAAPLICSPSAILSKPMRQPIRTRIVPARPMPPSAEPTVAFSKRMLQLLASAALESGLQDRELTDAIKSALQEAA